MTKPPTAPPDNTFVVRFRQEWTVTGPRWHGRIEHVQSGESVAFLNLDDMLIFLRRFGAIANEGEHLQESQTTLRN